MSDGTASRSERRARGAALGLASLLVHAALVWLLPPADLRSRGARDTFTPIEIVEWQAPHDERDRPAAPAEAEPAAASETPPSEAAPTEPARARPRAPGETSAPEVRAGPATPAEPAPVPAPAPDSGSDAVALPLANLRNSSGRGPITSPRLNGRTAGIGGDRHGAAVPPSTSGHTDATPKTLADAGFVRSKKGDLVYEDPLGHFKATLLPDGRVKFRDFAIARGTIRSGGRVAGMSEAIRSAQGKDLFYLDKKKLLERTEKLRLAMAVKFAESQVHSRMRQLYRDLLEIWSDGERTAVQRRERLFQRWDECVEAMRVEVDGFGESAKSSLDALREKAGGEARASIEAFIRRHLPKGSEDAYTPAELRELNDRRHSEARFDPYAHGSG